MSNDEKPHTERLHGALGGSTASQWTNCPGSYFYRQTIPPAPPGPAAIDGTKAHEIAEIVLNDFLEHRVTGSDPDVRANLLDDCDDDMVAAAKDYVKCLWENVLERSITGKYYGIEETFVLSKDFDMWGSADFWAVYLDDRAKRVGVIADFKYGYNQVKVEKNAQLAFYACAMQEEFIAMDKELDRVVAVIYQPRGGGEAYKETSFSNTQLKAWKKKFMQAGAQIFIKQKPKFKVGEWCRWCRAQAVCKAYAKQVITKSDLALVDTNITLPQPEQMDDKAIANIVLNADMLERFIDSCKQYAISRYIKGKALPGTKAIQSKGRRAWKTEKEEEIGNTLINYGVTNPFKKKLRGIGEIEKELKKILGPGVDDTMKGLTTLSLGSLSIVSEDDPRPRAVTSDDLLDNSLEISE